MTAAGYARPPGDPLVVIEEEVPERSYLAAVVMLGLSGVMLVFFVLLLLPRRGKP